MSSIVPASFNVSVGGTLQSFLNQAQGTTADTSLFGVLAGKGSATTNSIFGALQSNGSGTSAASATATALGSGGIKTTYHNVLQAIGGEPDGTLLQHWNANGSEPSALTTLRSYGWIKLTGKQLDPANNTPIGAYQFTAVGYAIYQRTGGGSIAGSSLNLTGASSSTTGAASSQTAAITSILSSLGFNNSSVAALAGSNTTSSSGSGSVLNVLA